MPVSTSLRGRVPGQTVISTIIAAQKDQPPRTLVAKICGVSPLPASSRRMFRAALGEVAVGEMLDQLGPKWDVLHAVPVVGDQIDHLVIGPPGVFTLTTENYPGKEVRISGRSMTVDGRAVDDIQSAIQLAARATERLGAAGGRDIAVQPIMVVVDSGKLTLREQPEGVTVVGSKQLLRFLTHLDQTLAGEEVACVSDFADRDTTWLLDADSDSESGVNAGLREDALELSRKFTILRAHVRDAAQARIFWGVVGFAMICCAAWAITTTLVEFALR